ncbi:hypothetical protein NIES3974_35040 [Calothrix sp. NIES-3974]|nr:hypothetical protein NIES3974_35040 [Calothrix sp. NIES-3974]
MLYTRGLLESRDDFATCVSINQTIFRCGNKKIFPITVKTSKREETIMKFYSLYSKNMKFTYVNSTVEGD